MDVLVNGPVPVTIIEERGAHPRFEIAKMQSRHSLVEQTGQRSQRHDHKCRSSNNVERCCCSRTPTCSVQSLNHCIEDTPSHTRRGDDCMIKNSLIIAPVILLLSVPALAQQPDARRGSALAREHCAPCHAIDNTSESPRAAAPPFRELRLKYAISDLQRPLTQGPHTRFQFEPSQIESLMAYLKTLDR
jgi:cytochrome c